jgi:CBS domain-containing membrane protein
MSAQDSPDTFPDLIPDSAGIEVELSDDDVYDAMRRIPGYLDITTEDFRLVYHLAHEHAVTRFLRSRHAHDVMRPEQHAVSPDTMLDETARVMARFGLKSIPVVDPDRRVIGVVSETDYLSKLGVQTFTEFLLKYVAEAAAIERRCHETPVSAIMTAPAVTVREDDDFLAVIRAFKSHPGRRMPVVDEKGRLVGVIARKDFIHACHLDAVE